MAALGAGAHGFVPKTADGPAMLLDAVRRALDGGVSPLPDDADARQVTESVWSRARSVSRRGRPMC